MLRIQKSKKEEVQKFRGSPLKYYGPKTCKIWADFTPLPTLITNISGTTLVIQNRKDM